MEYASLQPVFEAFATMIGVLIGVMLTKLFWGSWNRNV
jgi:hypothetical protein